VLGGNPLLADAMLIDTVTYSKDGLIERYFFQQWRLTLDETPKQSWPDSSVRFARPAT
jgi:hypothetical protein